METGEISNFLWIFYACHEHRIYDEHQSEKRSRWITINCLLTATRSFKKRSPIFSLSTFVILARFLEGVTSNMFNTSRHRPFQTCGNWRDATPLFAETVSNSKLQWGALLNQPNSFTRKNVQHPKMHSYRTENSSRDRSGILYKSNKNSTVFPEIWILYCRSNKLCSFI